MPAARFTSFPQLSTERLLLRQLIMQDAHPVFLLRTNEIVNRYLSRPRAKSLEDAMEFIRTINFGIEANEWIFWAVCLHDAQFAGTICLWNFSDSEEKAEIGYELLPQFHGKGLMQEALIKVMDFGFTILKLEKIEAWTTSPNEGSIKMLERSHFTKDLAAENKINRAIEGPDRVIYSISKTGYLKTGHP